MIRNIIKGPCIFFICLFSLTAGYSFSQSEKYVDSLRATIKNASHDTVRIQSMIKLAWALRSSDYTEAVETVSKAIQNINRIGYERGLGQAHLTLGNIYLLGGNYVLSGENYTKALAVYESRDDQEGIGKVCSSLGSLYTRQHNFPMAISYFEKSLAIKKAQNNKAGIAVTLNNLGTVYGIQKQNEKAREMFEQSLKIESEIGNARGMAESYQSLGNVMQNDFTTAIKFYNRALFIYDSIHDMTDKSGCLVGIANTLSKAGRHREALSYVEQAIALVEQFGILHNKEGTYDAAVKAYEGTGNHKEALKYLRKVINLNDSVYIVELTKKTVEIQEKYEAAKKERNILVLEQEKTQLLANNQRKTYLIVIAFVSAAFISALMLLIIVRNRSIKKQKEIEFEKSKIEFEQQALRAQMNPHFIFNAINSIQKYILKNDKQEAYDYLAKFARLIRIVLNNSQEKVLLLHQELEMIRLYVELEQLRFNNSFEFNVSVSEEVNEYTVAVPSMLMQPYIENAIWHGLMNLENKRKGILSLAISQTGNALRIVIEDNGIGRKLSREFKKDDSHRSLGMALTEQRLLMINKMQEYEDAKVIIADLNDNGEASGTRVEILIPLNEK